MVCFSAILEAWCIVVPDKVFNTFALVTIFCPKPSKNKTKEKQNPKQPKTKMKPGLGWVEDHRNMDLK